MTTHRYVGLLAAAVLAVSCSAGPPSSDPAPPGPAEAALAAYERFWSVSEAAFADPGARDWTPELTEVASGAALDSLLQEVRSYAAFPARTVGVVSRAPVVAGTSDTRVQVVDCVDLGDSRLVADSTGEVLDDLANRVQRYTYRAELVSVDGRWLVDQAEPALEESC